MSKTIDALKTSDVTFRIRRFNPEVDQEPRWEDYVIACYPTDRILDALHQIKGDLDGTLTFRRSCGHGICGSDAIKWQEATEVSIQALEKRYSLWDGVQAKLNSK